MTRQLVHTIKKIALCSIELHFLFPIFYFIQNSKTENWTTTTKYFILFFLFFDTKTLIWLCYVSCNCICQFFEMAFHIIYNVTSRRALNGLNKSQLMVFLSNFVNAKSTVQFRLYICCHPPIDILHTIFIYIVYICLNGMKTWLGAASTNAENHHHVLIYKYIQCKKREPSWCWIKLNKWWSWHYYSSNYEQERWLQDKKKRKRRREKDVAIVDKCLFDCLIACHIIKQFK